MLWFQSPLPAEYPGRTGSLLSASFKSPHYLLCHLCAWWLCQPEAALQTLAGCPAPPPEGKGPGAGLRLGYSTSGIPKATLCRRLFQDV